MDFNTTSTVKPGLFIVKILLHTIMEDIFDLCVVNFWQVIYGNPYIAFKGIPKAIGYYINVDWIRLVLDITV